MGFTQNKKQTLVKTTLVSGTQKTKTKKKQKNTENLGLKGAQVNTKSPISAL